MHRLSMWILIFILQITHVMINEMVFERILTGETMLAPRAVVFLYKRVVHDQLLVSKIHFADVAEVSFV